MTSHHQMRMRQWVCDVTSGDISWGKLHVQAFDRADAETKLGAMLRSQHIDGQIANVRKSNIVKLRQAG